MSERFTHKERALVHFILSARSKQNAGSRIVVTVVLSAIFAFSSTEDSDLGMWIAFGMLAGYGLYQTALMLEWTPVHRSLFEKLRDRGAFDEDSEAASES